MADRYWVGGAGNWSSTTKWSTTSGGASGASVPTSADNAIFDANSGTAGAVFTATVDVASTCANLTFSPVANVGSTTISLANQLTITGTLSTSSTAGNKRLLFVSAQAATYEQSFLSVVTAGAITDVDFRYVYVIGAAIPLTGTRIGVMEAVNNVTASAPKTVYWNLAGAQNWSANGWAATSGGAPSTDYFPLPQDSAIVNGSSPVSTITFDNAIPYISGLDYSAAQTGTSLTGLGKTLRLYGSFKGDSIRLSTIFANSFIFCCIGAATISVEDVNAGGQFNGNGQITFDALEGTINTNCVLSLGGNGVSFLSGIININKPITSAGGIASIGDIKRTVNFLCSSVECGSTWTTSGKNLTLNSGSTTISMATILGGTVSMNGYSLNNVSYASNNDGLTITTGGATITNFTINNGVLSSRIITLNDDITIGTLTVSSSDQSRRAVFLSNTPGTQRKMTVGSIVGSSIDFIDIIAAGTATWSGQFGNGGNNTGITFPAPKTVYWNLGGIARWYDNGWAATSGGTPSYANYPLMQDTAVFDNAGSASTVRISETALNPHVGAVDASARTIAITFQTGSIPSYATYCYGNWTNGSGVTFTGSGTISFKNRSSSTLTTAGATFPAVTVSAFNGTLTLSDALSVSNTLTIGMGTFDAATYNVTANIFSSGGSTARTIRMGSGTWTVTGTSWTVTSSGLTLDYGTAPIVFSYAGGTARTMNTGSLTYSKITIGPGSNFSFSDNLFSVDEIVYAGAAAITIAFGTTGPTVGKWSITGTAGNVATITGSINGLILTGGVSAGVDYIAFGTTTFSQLYAEWYVGANSTGSNAALIFSAAPAPVTRYWVGGTGTWDRTTTTNWSDTSGGAGGFSAPTSADTVIFDSASSATAYTVTIGSNAKAGPLTINGPASGNLTLAGTGNLSCFDNATIASTGVARTYTGTITLTGAATGRTLSSGLLMTGNVPLIVNGIGCGWALGSSWSTGTFNLTAGSFDTAGYAFSFSSFSVSSKNKTTLSFGASAISNGGTSVSFTIPTGYCIFNAGTSTVTLGASSTTWTTPGYTFNTIAVGTNGLTTSGSFTAANLSMSGANSTGIQNLFLGGNLTVTGAITASGATPIRRIMISSSSLGTQRTLTVNSWSSVTDVDFRDIAVTGSAAPISGTRLGDCSHNSGITFPAAKSVYWVGASAASWSSTSWAATSGGAASVNNFPLAQDTTVFDMGTAGTTARIDANWNIGSISTTARTSAFTIQANTGSVYLYGDITFGAYGAVSYVTAATWNFVGQKTQTLTLNANQFTPGTGVVINSPGGTVVLASAYDQSAAIGGGTLTLTAGTFDASTYNVTLQIFASSGALTRTLNMGSGTWTLAAAATVWNVVSTGLTLNKGTADIVLSDTTTTARFFNGGGLSYNKLTIGGATGTSTFTISDSNTFTEIASTKTVAHTISLAASTQTVGAFTVTGTAGNIVTLTGATASTPALIAISSGLVRTMDYVNVTYIRAMPVTTSWYAGANSTGLYTLGFIYQTGGALTFASTFTDSTNAQDTLVSLGTYTAPVAETTNALDAPITSASLQGAVLEQATEADSANSQGMVQGIMAETTNALDTPTTIASMQVFVNEQATEASTPVGNGIYASSLSDIANALDTPVAQVTFLAVVAETTNAVDAIAGGLFIVRAVDENANATDSIVAVRAFLRDVVEAATAAEVFAVAPSVFNAVMVEAATVQDILRGNTSSQVYLAEGVTVLDAATAAYLWSLIDDSQTPTWQNVNNTQTPTWTDINDSQTPGWTPVIP